MTTAAFKPLILAISLLLTPAWVVAQEAEPSVTLDLGIDAVLAGDRSNMSLVLSKQSGTPDIGALRVEIAFPARVLSFKEVSKGRGATASGAELKTAVVKSPDNPDEMILQVEVSASKPIPEGPLASLVFEVAKDFSGESAVKLKGGAVVVRSVDGATLTARTLDGTLTILNENSQVFSCFFYMH